MNCGPKGQRTAAPLRFLLLAILVFTFGVACSTKEETTTVVGSCSSRVSTIYSGPSERSYCSTVTDYSSNNPVTISVDAEYEKWDTTGSGLTTLANYPIRYAEVEVLDASGTRIQCGQLDASGQATLDVPASTQTLKVRVYSRINDNTIAKASVMDCPEENNVYYIQSTVVASDPLNPPATLNMVADSGAQTGADGEVQSAPFNILDRVIDANEFLDSEIGSCSGDFTGCTDVSVAEKVSIYWEQGFNPNEYYGAPTSGVSFYIPGYKRLFILGGINGDVDESDTDPFDDSVILHEYGHFLEDVYSISDSPGGSHSGAYPIDPRLAWSEGWGNFFQAAVLNSAFYRDSFGNDSDAGNDYGLFFNIPLASPSGSCVVGTASSGCDLPEYPAEGNFREFAITRYLWDLFDNGRFAELWATMTWSGGMKNTAQEFRNVGLLNEIQSDDLDPSENSDWSSFQSDTNNRTSDTTEYALYVDDTGSCSDFTMSPYDNPSDDNGSFSTSHLLLNNDFYFFKHPGGTLNVRLTYTTDDNVSGQESDLDLYVYNSSARLFVGNDIVASSESYFDNNPATAQTETASKSLAAGNYLIRVKMYTGTYGQNGCLGSICKGDRIPAGDDLSYTLEAKIGSGGWNQLCPATRP